MSEWLALAGASLLAVGYLWYAALVRRRNAALAALSSIDAQLQKRHDLLPNVLKIAARFMHHESDLLERITQLRAEAQRRYDRSDPASVARHLETEDALQASLGRLFALSEGYPELKSSDVMVNAQQTYEEVEGHISAARRFYNASVASLRSAIEIFPGGLIAGVAGVQKLPFFKASDASRAPVDASDWLN